MSFRPGVWGQRPQGINKGLGAKVHACFPGFWHFCFKPRISLFLHLAGEECGTSALGLSHFPFLFLQKGALPI